MFGTVNLVRDAIKSEFTYNGQGIAFQRAAMRNFGDGFAINVVICGVDNSLIIV